jgi:hypothetical protein
MISDAYHLHNWFDDFRTVRQKYIKYGHPDHDACMDEGSDVDMMVRRDKNLRHSGTTDETFHYLLPTVEGPRPIDYSNETYVAERYALLQSVEWDENQRMTSICCYLSAHVELSSQFGPIRGRGPTSGATCHTAMPCVEVAKAKTQYY